MEFLFEILLVRSDFIDDSTAEEEGEDGGDEEIDVAPVARHFHPPCTGRDRLLLLFRAPKKITEFFTSNREAERESDRETDMVSRKRQTEIISLGRIYVEAH
jgi:hypothetical protein